MFVFTGHALRQMQKRQITERMLRRVFDDCDTRVEVAGDCLNLYGVVSNDAHDRIPLRVTIDPFVLPCPLVITVAIAHDRAAA